MLQNKLKFAEIVGQLLPLQCKVVGSTSCYTDL